MNYSPILICKNRFITLEIVLTCCILLLLMRTKIAINILFMTFINVMISKDKRMEVPDLNLNISYFLWQADDISSMYKVNFSEASRM